MAGITTNHNHNESDTRQKKKDQPQWLDSPTNRSVVLSSTNLHPQPSWDDPHHLPLADNIMDHPLPLPALPAHDEHPILLQDHHHDFFDDPYLANKRVSLDNTETTCSFMSSWMEEEATYDNSYTGWQQPTATATAALDQHHDPHNDPDDAIMIADATFSMIHLEADPILKLSANSADDPWTMDDVNANNHNETNEDNKMIGLSALQTDSMIATTTAASSTATNLMDMDIDTTTSKEEEEAGDAGGSSTSPTLNNNRDGEDSSRSSNSAGFFSTTQFQERRQQLAVSMQKSQMSRQVMFKVQHYKQRTKLQKVLEEIETSSTNVFHCLSLTTTDSTSTTTPDSSPSSSSAATTAAAATSATTTTLTTMPMDEGHDDTAMTTATTPKGSNNNSNKEPKKASSNKESKPTTTTDEDEEDSKPPAKQQSVI